MLLSGVGLSEEPGAPKVPVGMGGKGAVGGGPADAMPRLAVQLCLFDDRLSSLGKEDGGGAPLGAFKFKAPSPALFARRAAIRADADKGTFRGAEGGGPIQ